MSICILIDLGCSFIRPSLRCALLASLLHRFRLFVFCCFLVLVLPDIDLGCVPSLHFFRFPLVAASLSGFLALVSFVPRFTIGPCPRSSPAQLLLPLSAHDVAYINSRGRYLDGMAFGCLLERYCTKLSHSNGGLAHTRRQHATHVLTRAKTRVSMRTACGVVS